MSFRRPAGARAGGGSLRGDLLVLIVLDHGDIGRVDARLVALDVDDDGRLATGPGGQPGIGRGEHGQRRGRGGEAEFGGAAGQS